MKTVEGLIRPSFFISMGSSPTEINAPLRMREVPVREESDLKSPEKMAVTSEAWYNYFKGMKCILGIAAKKPDFDYDAFFRAYADLWFAKMEPFNARFYRHPSAVRRVP